MNTLMLLGIASGLAMDAFSVSLTSGVLIKTPTPRHYFRLAFHFGLFQFLMPILGFYGGVLFESVIKKYDHWIAFALLLAVGGKMLIDSFKKDDDEKPNKDPSRGKTLILLSVATSIDAAAIGFTMAALGLPIFIPSAVIGLVCLLFSAAGVFLGSRLGRVFGKWAERFGGIVLITIGTKILIEHLFLQ